MCNTNRHDRMRSYSGLHWKYGCFERIGFSVQLLGIPLGLAFHKDMHRPVDVMLILRFRDLFLQVYNSCQTAAFFFFRYIIF